MIHPTKSSLTCERLIGATLLRQVSLQRRRVVPRTTSVTQSTGTHAYSVLMRSPIFELLMRRRPIFVNSIGIRIGSVYVVCAFIVVTFSLVMHLLKGALALFKATLGSSAMVLLAVMMRPVRIVHAGAAAVSLIVVQALRFPS